MFNLQLIILLIILKTTFSTLLLSPESPKSSLLQYGNAETHQTLLLTISPSETISESSITFSNPQICTDSTLHTTPISPTQHNFTAHLIFDAYPGILTYTISVITLDKTGLHRSYTTTETHHVYGLALYNTSADSPNHRTLLSGDNAIPLILPSFTSQNSPPTTLSALIHAPSPLDLTSTKFSLHPPSPSNLISPSNISLSNSSLTLSPHPFRVRGPVQILLELPDLVLHGESFETQFSLSIPSTPTPPPVISSGPVVNAISAQPDQAQFSLHMFNVASGDVVSASIRDHTFVGVVPLEEENGNRQVLLEGPSLPPADYPLLVSVSHENGPEARAESIGQVSVRFEQPQEATVLEGRKGRLSAAVWAGIGVAVLFVVLVVAGVVAVFISRRRRARREVQRALDNACLPRDGLAEPAAFPVARDVYGRGSVTVEQV